MQWYLVSCRVAKLRPPWASQMLCWETGPRESQNGLSGKRPFQDHLRPAALSCYSSSRSSSLSLKNRSSGYVLDSQAIFSNGDCTAEGSCSSVHVFCVPWSRSIKLNPHTLPLPSYLKLSFRSWLLPSITLFSLQTYCWCNITVKGKCLSGFSVPATHACFFLNEWMTWVKLPPALQL